MRELPYKRNSILGVLKICSKSAIVQVKLQF
jgi:hypothetical protein